MRSPCVLWLKLLSKTRNIFGCSPQEWIKCDRVRSFSRYVYAGPNLFCLHLENLRLKRKLCDHISEPWLLLCSCLACITDGVALPWRNRLTRKASPEVLFPRGTKQEAMCPLTVPTLLWSALCPKREVSKGLFKQYVWNDVTSRCSWKRTIPVLFLPAPGDPTSFGTCMSIFWDYFLCQSGAKTMQQNRLLPLAQQNGSAYNMAKRVWRHHEGQGRICSWWKWAVTGLPLLMVVNQ